METKEQRTETEIGIECQKLLMELGQKVYQTWLLDQEIKAANKSVYALNVEAYKLRAKQLEGNEAVSDG